MGDDSLGIWEPFDVAAVAKLMAQAGVLWWLSGGEALDLFLPRASRAHGDIDVSVRRSDWWTLRRFLASRMDVKIAHHGMLSEVTDVLDDDVHGFWARDSAGGPWRLQINLEPVDGTDWVYRRDPRVRRPLREVVWWQGALPYVNPAVQLLWKAKDPRPRDEQDRAAVMPLLCDDERQWLADAISLTCPASPWSNVAR